VDRAQRNDVLNLALALEHVGEDFGLLREAAALFVQEQPRLLSEIRGAVAAGDARALRHAAHTLKGAASHFSAGPTCQAALRLETMAREGRLDQVPEALAGLEAELSRLEIALNALPAA
jgi:HPt (histidine-containing phosphotransfer) domain-containing protein